MVQNSSTQKHPIIQNSKMKLSKHLMTHSQKHVMSSVCSAQIQTAKTAVNKNAFITVKDKADLDCKSLRRVITSDNLELRIILRN